jgi:hypothetical protein
MQGRINGNRKGNQRMHIGKAIEHIKREKTPPNIKLGIIKINPRIIINHPTIFVFIES